MSRPSLFLCGHCKITVASPPRHGLLLRRKLRLGCAHATHRHGRARRLPQCQCHLHLLQALRLCSTRRFSAPAAPYANGARPAAAASAASAASAGGAAPVGAALPPHRLAALTQALAPASRIHPRFAGLVCSGARGSAGSGYTLRVRGLRFCANIGREHSQSESYFAARVAARGAARGTVRGTARGAARGARRAKPMEGAGHSAPVATLAGASGPRAPGRTDTHAHRDTADRDTVEWAAAMAAQRNR